MGEYGECCTRGWSIYSNWDRTHTSAKTQLNRGICNLKSDDVCRVIGGGGGGAVVVAVATVVIIIFVKWK